MTRRVTEKQLEAQCTHLNTLTGSPLAPWTKGEDGRFHSNVGCFHINYDYNQPQLQRITNESGGVSNVLNYRGTKSEVSRLIYAYAEGIYHGQRNPIHESTKPTNQELAQ